MFTSSNAAESYIIQKRRQEEDRRAEYSKTSQFFKHGTEMAQWEVHSQEKHDRLKFRRRFEELKKHRQQELEQKRMRIKAFLQQQDAEAAEILKSMRETPQQRRARLEARARMLKAEREERRQQYAQEQRDRQWRINCDELRGQESKALAREVLELRGEQKKIHEEALRKLQEEEEQFDRQLKADVERQRLAEEAQYRARKEKEMENIAVLQNQRKEVELLREEEKQRDIKLKEELWAKWDQVRREEEAFEQEMRASNIQARAEMEHYNTILQDTRAKEMQMEKNNDAAIIAALVRQEKEKEEEERLRRAFNKLETEKYREHLKMQSEKEIEDERSLNALRNQEQDKQWAKREAVWRQEALAREKLHSEVLAGRTQQLEEKQRTVEQERLVAAQEKERLRALALREQQLRAEERDGASRKKREYRSVLDQQLQLKEMEAARAREREREESARMKAAREAEELRIAEELKKEIDIYKTYSGKSTTRPY